VRLMVRNDLQLEARKAGLDRDAGLAR